MKKLFPLILIAAIIAVCCLPAAAVVSQSDSYYVADYAGVLSDATEQSIIDYNGALELQCYGAQFVVVTVNYLDGMYSDEYANKLFNDWGVGSSTENNGMLLLLAVGENKAWLSTGAGISKSFTDSVASSYLDKYFWDDFDAEKYDSAVNSLFTAVLSWYDDYYSSSVISDPSQEYEYEDDGIDGYTVLIIIIFLYFLLRSRRRGGGGGLLPFLFLAGSRRRSSSGGSSFSSGRTGYSSGSHSSFGGGSHSSFGGHSGGFGGGSGHGGGHSSGGGAGRR